METIEFLANHVELEDPCSVSLSNGEGDWFGLALEENLDPDPDDATTNVYCEYYDQGNGGWGGLEAVALTPERLLVTLKGERNAVLNLTLQLRPESYAALHDRLIAIFRDAPERLQVASRGG